jgi:tyrosine-protein kinase Etk/Wzc
MDGDMRLGELHKIFNIKDNIGLAEYFSQAESTVTDITHSTSIDNIDFIPRGHRPFNPSALLASDRFSELMAQLVAQYDYIIIDSPPVLAASDALVLSQYADKVLMVTRANESLEGQLGYAIKQMRRANIQVDGIILNDMQHGLMDKYSYHYSYAYGDNK